MLKLSRRYLATLALFAVGTAGLKAASAAQVQTPKGVEYVTTTEGISEYRLKNGLRVLLCPDATQTKVTVNILYRVGSRFENYGETGMAHLLEHLLFKGSTHHPNVPKELTDHGAAFNGHTFNDGTNYFETVVATDENLKWALDLEADRMVNSFIAKKDLDSEMTVVRNEFEAGENHPVNILMQRVASTAYLWHNYGKSTIGARSDIERVPIERLQAFYHHFYQPDNALLVVAGKIDEAHTLALIDERFSPIPRPTRPLRTTYTSEPAQDGERAVTLRRTGDIQAACIAYHVPASSDPEHALLDLAADVLGDNPSGRLYKTLIQPSKAVFVAAFDQSWKDPGLLELISVVSKDKPLNDAVAGMESVVDELKSKPFTDEEISRAKQKWLKQFELAQNNSQEVALSLTTWEAVGDWRMWFVERDRIGQATAAQVETTALKYLVPSNRTLGRFIPDATPVRAEIADAPDLAPVLKDYKGEPPVAKGEAFDNSCANIDAHTIRTDLPGGLKLSLLPKKTRGGQVHALIVLHFGDETSLQNLGTTGRAVTEMLINGSRQHTREQIKDLFDKLKAEVSISGDAAGATIRIVTTKENLAPALDLAAEVLKEPAFPASELAEIKHMRVAELEYVRHQPGSAAQLEVERFLNPYPKGDVRYVETIDEQIASWNAVTPGALRNFYDKFWGASYGEVVLVGDFDPTAVQKQIGAQFGSWKTPAPYKRIESHYRKLEPKQMTIECADMANATWQFAVPVQINDTNPDYPASVLAGYLIGGSMNSRLVARVRGKEGLSYGIGANFRAPAWDDNGYFVGFAICAPQNGPKVETSVKDELQKVLERGFTPEEVAAAKKSWIESCAVSRANDFELMYQLFGQRFTNRSMAFQAELERNVAALSPEQLEAFMRKYVDLSRMSFFRAGDFKKANVSW